MPDDADDPYLIAVEQYVFWREVGLSNAAMLEAVGLTSPPSMILDAETTIRGLAQAYRNLYPRRAA